MPRGCDFGTESRNAITHGDSPKFHSVMVDTSALYTLWREDRHRVSLVDCVGFEFMRIEGISVAFALDPHFEEAGFEVLPPAGQSRNRL